MQLQDFFDYKNQLMKDLLTNETIVNLVKGGAEISDPSELAYSNIFPYEYLPEITEDGKTFICFEVDVQSVTNKTFLIPTLYIWVFSHKSLLRMPEGGVLTDKICSEICNTINGSRYYGLGELNLYAAKRFSPMMDFSGKLMTFHATEFNHQFNGRKPVPSNRKA